MRPYDGHQSGRSGVFTRLFGFRFVGFRLSLAFDLLFGGSLGIFLLAGAHVVRLGLAAIVGGVEAAALELHRRRMDELLQSTSALRALLYVPSGELLDFLKLVFTLLALVLVKGHAKPFAYLSFGLIPF